MPQFTREGRVYALHNATIQAVKATACQLRQAFWGSVHAKLTAKKVSRVAHLTAIDAQNHADRLATEMEDFYHVLCDYTTDQIMCSYIEA
jgi:hypothetical protein